MASVPQIEIRNHPTSAAHMIVKAITRGRVYAVTFAEPFPTVEEAQQLWREERQPSAPTMRPRGGIAANHPGACEPPSLRGAVHDHA